MKKEDLFEAMGDVDDKYILEAATPYKKLSRPLPFAKILGACACLLLTVGVVLATVNSPLFNSSENSFIGGGDSNSNFDNNSSDDKEMGGNSNSESSDNYGESDSDCSSDDSSPNAPADPDFSPGSPEGDGNKDEALPPDAPGDSDNSESAGKPSRNTLSLGNIVEGNGWSVQFSDANEDILSFSATNCDTLPFLIIYEEEGVKKYANTDDLDPSVLSKLIEETHPGAIPSDAIILLSTQEDSYNGEEYKAFYRLDLGNISSGGQNPILAIYLVLDSGVYLLSLQ